MSSKDEKSLPTDPSLFLHRGRQSLSADHRSLGSCGHFMWTTVMDASDAVEILVLQKAAAALCAQCVSSTRLTSSPKSKVNLKLLLIQPVCLLAENENSFADTCTMSHLRKGRHRSFWTFGEINCKVPSEVLHKGGKVADRYCGKVTTCIMSDSKPTILTHLVKIFVLSYLQREDESTQNGKEN